MVRHHLYGHVSPCRDEPAGGRGPCRDGGIATLDGPWPARARHEGMKLGRDAYRALGFPRRGIHALCIERGLVLENL